MAEIVGLDGKPIEFKPEAKEMEDQELAEELATRFLHFFAADIMMTAEQRDWVFRRLYHIFRRQELPDREE